MTSKNPTARPIVSAIFLLFAIAQAHAADPCKGATTDMQLRECESKSLSAADAKLNIAYSKLTKLLDAEGKKKLKEAQRAWIAFRDANAVFAGDLNRGGTAEDLNIIGTKTNMTNARVKELQSEIEARE